MTTTQVPPESGAEVIRAIEAGTETRLHEGQPPGPAYVDLADGRAKRKPIVPPHLFDGEGLAGLWRGIRRHRHHRAVERGRAGCAGCAPQLAVVGYGAVPCVRGCG